MKALYEQSTESVNRSMPPGVVIPELAYSDVGAAVDWLCHTFGFEERLRIGNHRAQLLVGAGTVIVTDQTNNPGAESSEPSASRSVSGESSHSVMVRVADVDRHYEHTKQSGARIVSLPMDYPFGERQYAVVDLGGHRWVFSQTIADIDPKVWGGTLLK